MNVGTEAKMHTFLISAPSGCEWSAWRPDCIIPGYPPYRRLGGPYIAGPDAMVKQKSLTW